MASVESVAVSRFGQASSTVPGTASLCFSHLGEHLGGEGGSFGVRQRGHRRFDFPLARSAARTGDRASLLSVRVWVTHCGHPCCHAVDLVSRRFGHERGS